MFCNKIEILCCDYLKVQYKIYMNTHDIEIRVIGCMTYEVLYIALAFWFTTNSCVHTNNVAQNISDISITHHTQINTT